MSLLQHALRAGSQDAAAPLPRRASRGLLVAGGAGPLGSAVLERALAIGPWRPVTALVTQPIEVALNGLRVAQVPADWSMAPEVSGPAECALIVFDRDSDFQRVRFRFYRQDHNVLAEIEPSEFPKAIATQNMWLSADERESARDLNSADARFRKSLTAKLWRQLETGT